MFIICSKWKVFYIGVVVNFIDLFKYIFKLYNIFDGSEKNKRYKI